MRWSQQTIEAEERASLPGYRDEAVVRHFEAPDSVPTRFYEVRAKSILNRVPEASRMPFRWTVNPFRGCTHACNYCMSGETLILMADGRVKELQALSVGDRIYGTQRGTGHRVFAHSTVLDKWSSLQPAYEVELEDGTHIIASDTHRFLTNRGWKHVVGSDSGALQRAHLNPGIKLLGPGPLCKPPIHDAAYRRGYLCGLIRGDGYRCHYERVRRDGRRYTAHRFCLALTDSEPLERATRFFDELSIRVRLGLHSVARGNRRRVMALHSDARDTYEQIDDLVSWPAVESREWRAGFLAGMFDAEGCWARSRTLSISSGDDQLIRRVVTCLKAFGFRHSILDQRRPGSSGVTHVRILGGLAEHVRFHTTVDPSITRKRSIEGRRLWTNGRRRVVSVRPLGVTIRMYDITTSTGDFIADGVVSHNCFARPTHTYLDLDAGRDFEREIVVKVNAPERLRVELRRPSWKGEHIALGTNTDPYQWVEGRYKLMRGIWEAMIEARNPGSVLTKSPLLLRDLDLMLELARRAEFSAALSVPTIDERAWRATEPHTPSPHARLEAVAKLTAAGIRTGVLVAPLMPGINDDPEQVREILRLCTEAGAAYVTGIALHLRSGVRQVFMEWLRAERPELVDRYRELYRRGAYAPAGERRRLAALLESPDRPTGEGWTRGTQRESPPRLPPAASASAHGQERLFDLC